eukprot:TRINITY_DN59625_c0_g1_i1.p1 TRINITY_DN59625_c0_g1~~TRINITY_DN59625_c0_g1_i1.p1  ORF type:complete len:464 (-),score=25.34 TRINITY_DN59625_c0_g1_i1:226-1617(-)
MGLLRWWWGIIVVSIVIVTVGILLSRENPSSALDVMLEHTAFAVGNTLQEPEFKDTMGDLANKTKELEDLVANLSKKTTRRERRDPGLYRIPPPPPPTSTPTTTITTTPNTAKSTGKAKGKGKGKGKKIQYLFYRPRCCSGINNQLEEFWYAFQLAINMGRGLVLPMIAEHVTWTRVEMKDLTPFDEFFDSSVVRQLVPTMTTKEWKQMCNSTFELDIFPKNKNKIVQKGYEKYLNITWQGVQKLVVSSWDDLKDKDLPDCLGVQWPLQLLKGVFNIQRAKTDPPIGGLVEKNPTFEKLRRHTVAAPFIMSYVAPITAKLGKYLAVHVRVGDFKKWCKDSPDPRRCPTDKNMADKVRKTAQQHGITEVFVACDVDFKANVLKWMKEYNPNLNFHTFDSPDEPFKSHVDVTGVAEQQICIDAPVFIGNCWSTWSRTVHEGRYTTGKSCDTTLIWNSETPWCMKK